MIRPPAGSRTRTDEDDVAKTERNRVREGWDRLRPLPGGRRLFSRFLGLLAPYSGTIRPRVEELREGYARVGMRDRRGVRNHLSSLHAIALMNLAEVASGLALMYSLPADARAILVGLRIEYLKKARGTITAEAAVAIPETSERREYEFESVLRDASGETVARAHARWLVGPRPQF
jgi:acyl-coenzyme A thioesterase PaaI-like protein